MLNKKVLIPTLNLKKSNRLKQNKSLSPRFSSPILKKTPKRLVRRSNSKLATTSRSRITLPKIESPRP